MKYELEDALKENLFEKLFSDRAKDWELSSVLIEYDVDVELMEIDHEFGTKREYEANPFIESIIVSIPEESGEIKELYFHGNSDYFLSLLGESLYDSIHEKIDQDSYSYWDQIIDRINNN